MPMRLFVAGVLLAASAALVGCGGASTVTVDGKVVNGDKAYTSDSDVTIGLVSEDGKTNKSNKAEADGSFKIDGVPTGKYKVSVTRYPKPQGDAAKPAASPPMPSTKQLPEAVEITTDKHTITVDLAKLK